MMKQPTLTVFTPAYNRAYCIEHCYRSLCQQTSPDFEWLVIDDGSTDNTRELIESYMAEAKISIRYIYQSNQGMHGAHNTAYRNITTELNVSVDSDDYLTDDAVEKIVTFWKKHGSDKYAGIIGLDQAVDGDIIGTRFPSEMKETTLKGFYRQGGKGDKKLVYRTDVITRYPEYPLFEGEKYVGLAYKYSLIDQDYTLLVLDEVLCMVDYQTDGSSMNMYRQYWNNPKGFAFLRKTEMQLAPSLKRRYLEAVHYVSSSIISKNSRFMQETPKKRLTFMAIPFGVALYLFIRYNVKHDKLMKI